MAGEASLYERDIAALSRMSHLRFFPLAAVGGSGAFLHDAPRLVGSFAEMRRARGEDGVLDPLTLCLPAGSPYTPDMPRQRYGEIARDTPVRLLEEFPDGWVRVQYEGAEKISHEAYCLRWDLSLPDLPAADPAIRAQAMP